MSALITGSSGFVGQHLATELCSHDYTVYEMDIVGDDVSAYVDILDSRAVVEHISTIKPDRIYHLAAQPSVPISWKHPQKTFELNVIGTLNILEAMRNTAGSCRIIIVGSSDQYGVTGAEESISEDRAMQPRNPYAASKTAQEEIARVYAEAYSLDICYTHSFNHSGPGQKPGFLIPDLCKGIVQIERGEIDSLKHGNLEAVRDFTDVRDVVRAYRLIGERGISGEVYNVGSGTGRKAQEILDILLGMAEIEIPVRQDSGRIRASDTPILTCDNSKLRKHTGWAPEIPIEETLKDTLDYYRSLQLATGDGMKKGDDTA
jgi:GDP-4-dehydro-6-deoxy-D-mannose reductase